MSKNEYKIDKWIWSEADFEKMGWHDCPIYAVGIDDKNFKLLFDIDYIFKWVESKLSGKFKFWISPATLIFENVNEAKIDIDCDGQVIEIFEIEREDPRTPKNVKFIEKNTEWKWIIGVQGGDICFRSVGYKQYIRRKPILIENQEIGLKERGGFSFNTNKEN